MNHIYCRIILSNKETAIVLLRNKEKDEYGRVFKKKTFLEIYNLKKRYKNIIYRFFNGINYEDVNIWDFSQFSLLKLIKKEIKK